KDSGLEPFTILSCDNLPENGHVARQTVVGLAKQMVPDLAGWIEANVAFPSSMVDCITPATSAREVGLVAQKFEIQDDAPVACEPFRQWVMEDRFPAGRPSLEAVGVQFVDDVAPYELMKLRILNGGHAAIAYPSALLGYHFVHEAMADPDITGWFKKLARTDVIPVVPPIPGIDFDEYLETCVSRFANPEIGDTVARLCLDGSNRQPKFILPTIADALHAGRLIEGLALEVAFWCRYCAESVLSGSGVILEDERAEQLRGAAIRSKENPTAFLALDDVFGDLGRNDVFAKAFERQLNSLWERGTRKTLQAYLSEGSH
ncbi:MAG: mannitol dehydrogenase family protein, partial [Paracoccaceae bacterium]